MMVMLQAAELERQAAADKSLREAKERVTSKPPSKAESDLDRRVRERRQHRKDEEKAAAQRIRASAEVAAAQAEALGGGAPVGGAALALTCRQSLRSARG